jgi:ATP-dependent Clp protease ATP-binding subunit ClpC
MPPLIRLDADAEAVMKSAQQIAREYDLDYVGTEHVLLAIVRRSDSIGARVLAELGVDEPKTRQQIDELIQKSKEDTWVLGRLPGTPHFKNVITLAIEEAGQLESASVGTGHLLLALLREQGCVADRALHNLGVRLKAARQKVVHHLSA